MTSPTRERPIIFSEPSHAHGPEGFWSRVDRSGGPDACWPWLGSINAKGYGRRHHQGKLTLAHRVALLISGVTIPEGYTVDHLCRNRACQNPAHLEAVPHRREELMKERPILFSGSMVRAILAGKKNQTRRIVQSPARNMQREGMEVIKHRPPGDTWYKDHVWSMRGRTGVWGDYTDARFKELCPYGAPGDRLWVRETFHSCPHCPQHQPRGYTAYRSDEKPLPPKCAAHGWRPSIFMRRHASRITLEVTDVRVERLQAITEADACAEGIGSPLTRDCKVPVYAGLWDSINAKRGSWASNPWVWVIEFRRIES